MDQTGKQGPRTETHITDTDTEKDRDAVFRQLEDTRLRFESTLAAAEVGTWTWDCVNDVVVADQNFAKMFGVSAEVGAGGKIEQYLSAIHPDDRASVAVAIDQALADRETFEQTYRLMQWNGAVRWVIARGRVVRDESGKAINLPGVMIDITESKVAEQNLRKSEERYRTLFNLINEGFCIIEKVPGEQRDFRYVETNPNFAEHSGLGDVLGKTIRELFPDEADQWFDIYDEVFRTGKPMTFERELEAQGRFLEVHAYPLEDEAGRRLAIAFTDISARKQSEAELRKLNYQIEQQAIVYNTTLSAITDYVYRLNKDGRFIYANQALLDLWGLKEIPAGGISMPELSYPKIVEARVLEGVERVFATRQTFKSQTEYTSPTGAVEYHEFIFNPVFAEDGSVDFVIGSSRDISEHKTLENALKDADRRKDEFLATLAHELRNPLAPIRSGLEVIGRHGEISPEVDKTLGIIQRQTDQIVRLVDDLIEISRITLGKVTLKKERIELQTAVNMAVETCRGAIESNGHHFTLTMPDEPVYIDADFTRVTQIVLNILNNAAKYTPPGGDISLIVSTGVDNAEIVITDTGVGIPAESLPTVFDLFSQLEAKHDPARGGLGIGLSVARELTQMHGGKIIAASGGRGQGSKFTLTFPLAAEQVEIGSDEKPETAAAAIETEKAGAQKRVLVVDDNTDAAEMLQVLLEMHGYEVKTVFDAETALAEVEAFAPAACLCDIGLPLMNGYELAERLRKMMPDVLLISISGWGQDEDRRRSQESGFNHHLVKPVAFDALIPLVKQIDQ
jgi:PAS domain S-box-containing protein